MSLLEVIEMIRLITSNEKPKNRFKNKDIFFPKLLAQRVSLIEMHFAMPVICD